VGGAAGCGFSRREGATGSGSTGAGRFDSETFSERKILVKDDYGRDIGDPPALGVNSESLDPAKLEPIGSHPSRGCSRYTALGLSA